MTDSTWDPAETTRRGLLRRGLTLAVAAPVLLSSLTATTAWADDDEDEDDDNRRRRGHDLRPAEVRNHDDDDQDDDVRLVRFGLLLSRFSTGLCRVSDASGFNANNAGSDPLTAGRLRLVGRQNNADDDKIAVVLRGALANAAYEVLFIPSSGGRESLGNVGPTNDNGSLVALTPNALAGAHRVGVFVLARDGHDQFVSCLGD